ncbi:hypothetical protein KSF78_0001050 [Schistosoma japonicum]|nr:hypothetical protein KSF78_0001050 [Schistosoma japonicum]
MIECNPCIEQLAGPLIEDIIITNTCYVCQCYVFTILNSVKPPEWMCPTCTCMIYIQSCCSLYSFSYVEYCIANKYNDCSYIHDLRRNVNADIMKHSSYNCAIIIDSNNNNDSNNNYNIKNFL